MKKYVVHSGYRKSKPVTAERIQQRYADGEIQDDATVQESGTTFSVPIAVFINDCVMNSRTQTPRRPANGKRPRRKTNETESAAPGTSSPATAPSPPPPTAKPSAPPKPRRTKTLTTTKPCPFCFEPIQIEARKCKHCGELLDPTLVRASLNVHPPKTRKQRPPGKMRSRLRVLWAVGTIGAVLVTIMLMTPLFGGMLERYFGTVQIDGLPGFARWWIRQPRFSALEFHDSMLAATIFVGVPWALFSIVVGAFYVIAPKN